MASSHILQDRQPLLYSLVFGEGVVNDATSIVLLRAVVHLNLDRSPGNITGEILSEFLKLFFSSLIVGVIVGLVSAMAVRYLFRSHSTDR